MKVTTLVDSKLVINVPSKVFWFARTPKERAKAMSNWANEFKEFIRDHRSQSDVGIEVEEIFKDLCSHCEREYEEDAEGPLCCQDAIDEWQATKKTAA